MAEEKKDKPEKKKPGKEQHKKPGKAVERKEDAGKKAEEKAKKPTGKKSERSAKEPEKKEKDAKKKPTKEKEKDAKKKPIKIAKSNEVKRLSRLIKVKKRRMFRGRFGKRSVRKVSNRKWKKWRKPRGIDIYFKKEDGLVPGTGYRTSREIRFVHPSGYRERLVLNMQQLFDLEKEKERVAARLSGKIGRKKKAAMLRKADELKILVLNR